MDVAAIRNDECGCVDMCTKKHISVNHKVMQVYMEIQPLLIKKRIEEMNKQQAALEETREKELETSQHIEILGAEKPNMKNMNEPKELMNVTPGGEHVTDKKVIKSELQ